jgi:signal transduction histidine kinase
MCGAVKSITSPTSVCLLIVDQLLEGSLAYTRSLIEYLAPAGLRMDDLISALDMLALEIRQQGYQVSRGDRTFESQIFRADNYLSLSSRP